MALPGLEVPPRSILPLPPALPGNTLPKSCLPLCSSQHRRPWEASLPAWCVTEGLGQFLSQRKRDGSDVPLAWGQFLLHWKEQLQGGWTPWCSPAAKTSIDLCQNLAPGGSKKCLSLLITAIFVNGCYPRQLLNETWLLHVITATHMHTDHIGVECHLGVTCSCKRI